MPHPLAMLIMGVDVSHCWSSPGTCRGKTDPVNGNTEHGGSIQALVLWSVSVGTGEGRSAHGRWKRRPCLSLSPQQVQAGEGKKPLTLQTWKVDLGYRKERKGGKS